MAGKRIPIPHQLNQLVDKQGTVSTVWYQFFTKIFTNISNNINTLEGNVNPLYLSDTVRIRTENEIIYFEINDSSTWKEAGQMSL